MKFDATRAASFLRELGDPRYSGPDGEARAADLVASRFEGMGLNVERREVNGSRFPQRVGPWVAWLGYGFLATINYALVLQDNLRLLVIALFFPFSLWPWVNGLISNGIRPGRRHAPLEPAPVVIATLPHQQPAPIRVVFQSVMSGVKADPFHFAVQGTVKTVAVYGFLLFFPFFWAEFSLMCKWILILDPKRSDLLRPYAILTRDVYPPFLVMVWLGVVAYLAREYRRSRGRAGRDRPDGRGLAVLLEMARTWPRTGPRSIEPVFVAAGGHPLDYAGSREVVRLLKSEWSSTPFLLVLFFAPGAGDELWLCTNAPADSGLDRLAEDAARSLWIPYRGDELFALLSLWPFERCTPAISVMGSDHRAFDDDTVDPQALSRAAQLATEIALRWAKKQDAGGSPESAG